MEKNIECSDGRGLTSGTYTNINRTITKDMWLREAFPEWGTFLNREIEKLEVSKGQVSMWWCGGSSWVLKTDEGGIFFIDMFSGGSGYTELSTCGVCRQSGADSSNWLRLNPQVIDPWEFKRLDGCFITHVHQDHCDIYSVKAALQTTNAKFYGPKVVTKRLQEFEVPDERITLAEVGKTIEIPGAKVHIMPCFDDTAIRTGGAAGLLDYDDACVCFLFETSGGNILFMGDTWYNDGYSYFSQFFDIDVAIFDMGYNHPGATDKMTPYDCVRLGKALNAKVLIPDHYDNLAAMAWDPSVIVNQFERIATEMTPEIKTVIMQCGGRFDYPKDQDIKHYRYKPGAVGVDINRVDTYKKMKAKFDANK